MSSLLQPPAPVVGELTGQHVVCVRGVELEGLRTASAHGGSFARSRSYALRPLRKLPKCKAGLWDCLTFWRSPRAGMSADDGGERFRGANATDLLHWLATHGVETTAYGEGESKSITELMDEVQKGESVLQVVDGRALRTVRVLNLLVRNSKGEVLVEEKQVRPDGTVRKRGLPLSEKLYAEEFWRPAVYRAVEEELGSLFPGKPNVTICEDTFRQVVEVSESVSYPGLLTQYRCNQVEVYIDGIPETQSFMTREPKPTGVLELYWAWKSPSQQTT